MKTSLNKAAVLIAALALVVLAAISFFTAERQVLPSFRADAATAAHQANTAPSAASSELGSVQAQEDNGGTWWRWGLPFIATFALAGTTLLLVFRQRKREALLASPHLVTPESFRKWTGDVTSTIDRITNATQANSKEVRESRTSLESSFIEMSQTFLTLQRALDQRDQQLKRAEQGWELQIFKKFLVRFARVDELLNDHSEIDSDARLTQARLMMRDALEECGVEEFRPLVGSDYRTEKGVDDRPTLSHVEDPSLFYRIKNVQAPGYCVRTADGNQVIVIPARVEVYAPGESKNG